jgi:hypothetical protein
MPEDHRDGTPFAPFDSAVRVWISHGEGDCLPSTLYPSGTFGGYDVVAKNAPPPRTGDDVAMTHNSDVKVPKKMWQGFLINALAVQ